MYDLRCCNMTYMTLNLSISKYCVHRNRSLNTEFLVINNPTKIINISKGLCSMFIWYIEQEVLSIVGVGNKFVYYNIRSVCEFFF